jgi:hypothetical protein
VACEEHRVGGQKNNITIQYIAKTWFVKEKAAENQ